MILITSIGEFLLYYCQFFFYYFHFTVKKKKVVIGLFLGCPAFVVGIHFLWVKIMKASSSVQVLWENLL